jgi:hypothetical protein
MRIEIKYTVSMGSHLFDLNAEDLDRLRSAEELSVRQDDPAKSLHIDGRADELELLAAALLNRAIELRRRA